MDILVGYGVSPRMDIILQHYWGHLSMVAKAGHYGITLFKGYIGVTQGGTISPTIFNMVIDLVIHYSVILVARKGSGPYVFGRSVQWLSDFFYADDGLLDLTKPAWIQAELDVLQCFYRWALKNNLYKSAGVIFHPCYIFSRHSEAAYTWRMIDVGPYFWDRQRRSVWCSGV